MAGKIYPFDFYCVGDRVICAYDYACLNSHLLRGDLGTVVDVTSSADCSQIGVEWDKEVLGHDCHGNAEYGHGWYMTIEGIEPYEPHDSNNNVDFEYSEKDMLDLLTA